LEFGGVGEFEGRIDAVPVGMWLGGATVGCVLWETGGLGGITGVCCIGPLRTGVAELVAIAGEDADPLGVTEGF